MSPLTAYILLGISVITEIIATSTLPATEGFTKWKPSLILITGYVVCFFCFGLSLSHIQLGIAYGTWGAIGTAVTPLIGYILYRQRTTKVGLFGIALTMVGVVLLHHYG